MKKILFQILIMFVVLQVNGQTNLMTVTGDARKVVGSQLEVDLVTRANQTGGAWFNNAFSLDDDFVVEVTANLGTFDSEGFAFVLQNSGTNPTVAGGELMGVPTVGNSYIVEFDLKQSGSQTDAMVPHVSLFKDGSLLHQGENSLFDATLGYPLSQHETLSFIWNASLQQFTVRRENCDSTLLMDSSDIKTNIFGGVGDVYLGFTASNNIVDDTVSFSVNYQSNTKLVDQVVCQGGTAQLSTEYFSGFTWSSPDVEITDSLSHMVAILPENMSQIYLSIEGQCELYIDTVIIDVNDTLSLDYNVEVNEIEQTVDITLSVMGGSLPYSYYWVDSQNNTFTSQDITSGTLGEYNVSITDANNCVSSRKIFANDLSVDNVEEYFSPDGDGINETIIITVPGNSKILDQYGGLVKEVSYKQIWDGTNMYGALMKSGIYVVVNDEGKQYISLLR